MNCFVWSARPESISIPVCTINLTQLRELEQAAAECAELAAKPVLCEPASN